MSSRFDIRTARKLLSANKVTYLYLLVFLNHFVLFFFTSSLYFVRLLLQSFQFAYTMGGHKTSTLFSEQISWFDSLRRETRAQRKNLGAKNAINLRNVLYMSMREIVQSSQKTLSLRNLGAGCREKRTVISRSTITRCVLVLDFANVAQSTAQDFCVDLTPRSGACRCHLSSDQIIRTGSWKLYTMLAEYCTSYRFAESSGRFFTRPNEFIVCFISLVFVLVLGASCSISSRYVRRKKKENTQRCLHGLCWRLRKPHL